MTYEQYKEAYDALIKQQQKINNLVYNQALDDFITAIERQTTFYCGKDSHLRQILEQLKK